jgi:two-component system OmpR family response regulator/two-component system response regulator TctD
MFQVFDPGGRLMQAEARILVVEDDPAMRRALCLALRASGMRVATATNFRRAALRMDAGGFDLVLLDLMLPDASGLRVLDILRERQAGDVAVLIISALDGLDQRIQGLDLGAHGYLVKPFAFEELLARVRALLRRRPHPVALPQLGKARFDFAMRRLLTGQRSIQFSVLEWSALDYLRANQGRLVTKADVLRAMRRLQGDGVSDNAVEVLIHRLRQKVGDTGLRIDTVRGLGYVLEVEET